MKPTRILTIVFVVAIMALAPGLAFGQSPAPEQEGMLKGFEGEILANGTDILGNAGTLSITAVGHSGEKEIYLKDIDDQPNYQLKVPGRFNVTDAAQVLEPGTGVAILARLEDGHWNAVQVLVKPESPTIAPKIGVVVDANPEEGTLKLVTPDGETRTLEIPRGMAAPSTGELVVAFTRRAFDGKDLRTLDAPDSVSGLARASEVRERLEHHLEEITSTEGSLGHVDEASKEIQVQRLTGLLENHAAQRKTQLNATLAKAEEDVKEAIKEALNEADIDDQKAKAAVKKALEKVAQDAAMRDSDNSNTTDDSDDGGSPEQSGTSGSTSDSVDDTASNTTDAVDEAVDGTTDAVDEAVDDTTDAVDEAVDGTTDAVDEAVDETTDAVDEAVDETTDAVDEAVDETTDAVDEAVDDVTDTLDKVTGSGSDSSGSSDSGSGSDSSGSSDSGSGSDSSGSSDSGSGSDSSGSSDSGSGSDSSGSSDSGSGSDSSGSSDSGSGSDSSGDDSGGGLVDKVKDTVDKVLGGL